MLDGFLVRPFPLVEPAWYNLPVAPVLFAQSVLG